MRAEQRAVTGSILVHLLFLSLAIGLNHFQFPKQELPPVPVYISLQDFFQPADSPTASSVQTAVERQLQPAEPAQFHDSADMVQSSPQSLRTRLTKKVFPIEPEQQKPQTPVMTPKQNGVAKQAAVLQHLRPEKMQTNKPATGDTAEASGPETYLAENFSYIRDLIAKNIVFPPIARKLGWRGTLTVSFALDSAGNASAIRIIKSSGKELLDRNVVAAIKKTTPFPSPKKMITLVLPVTYNFR